MILTTISAVLALSTPAVGATDLNCPVMGGPAPKEAVRYEYAGAEYAFCCEGCDSKFVASSESFLKKAKGSDKPIANFLFDPITGKAIKVADAKYQVIVDGIRYSFAADEHLTAFNADRAKYTARPKKESWNCPVTGEAVVALNKASGYADFEGVRYYFCCAGCEGPFAKDPAKFAADAEGVRAAKVVVRKADG